MPTRTDDRVRCSFCGKTQDQVRKLIAGSNNVFICDECIELCGEILAEELEEEELEGFSLDAERQAIINRYMNQTQYDSEGEYRYVKVDESGHDVVEEDDYKIVRADEETKALPENEEKPSQEEESEENP